MKNAIQTARKLREKPADFAEDAANLLLAQEMEITKLRFALTKIADSNEPMTALKSIARQALVKQ